MVLLIVINKYFIFYITIEAAVQFYEQPFFYAVLPKEDVVKKPKNNHLLI
jgi:hypothetical protein